jgi:tetratricopeptide (TPR) repeat protein
MKKFSLLLMLAISITAFSQNKSEYSKIDLMLINGNYDNAIDTCRQILLYDSLNATVFFKMGQAYQSILSDDKALECFERAVSIAPDIKYYNFTLAKSYYNKGKTGKAKPILLKLCEADSMYWPYAFYLTSIYIQEQKYNESIEIYNRFYERDTMDYIIIDKIGFASLKAGDFNNAMFMFNKSLEINPKNTNAIKNLAYIYAGTISGNKAIRLLTTGIEIDSTDMDLYARRAAINFTVSNFVKALNDYQIILASGDSSVLVMKRAGIGYSKDNQPQKAIFYLMKAYVADTTDLETASYLAQTYGLLKEYKNSAFYYRKVIDKLGVAEVQLGLNYLLLAEILKSDNQYHSAINAYLKSQDYRSDNSIYMIVANLYDEKLKDYPRAIRYYELYLGKLKTSKSVYDTDYTESVRMRVESLKKMTARQP